MLVFHADRARAEYRDATAALEAELAARGFERTTYHTLTSDAFAAADAAGADIWRLPVSGRRVLKFSVEGATEFCLLLFSESLRTTCVAEVTQGNRDWALGPLPMVELVDGVEHFTDRDYCFDHVPDVLRGCAMTKNPCHCFDGLEIKISAYNEDVGVLIAESISLTDKADRHGLIFRLDRGHRLPSDLQDIRTGHGWLTHGNGKRTSAQDWLFKVGPPIPEPGTGLLMGFGLAGLARFGRRRDA